MLSVMSCIISLDEETMLLFTFPFASCPCRQPSFSSQAILTATAHLQYDIPVRRSNDTGMSANSSKTEKSIDFFFFLSVQKEVLEMLVIKVTLTIDYLERKRLTQNDILRRKDHFSRKVPSSSRQCWLRARRVVRLIYTSKPRVTSWSNGPEAFFWEDKCSASHWTKTQKQTVAFV